MDEAYCHLEHTVLELEGISHTCVLCMARVEASDDYTEAKRLCSQPLQTIPDLGIDSTKILVLPTF